MHELDSMGPDCADTNHTHTLILPLLSQYIKDVIVVEKRAELLHCLLSMRSAPPKIPASYDWLQQWPDMICPCIEPEGDRRAGPVF
jgi:hypothetical protein